MCDCCGCKEKKEEKCCSEEQNKEQCCEEKKEDCCSNKEDHDCCHQELPSAEELVEEVKKEDENKEFVEVSKEVEHPAEEQGIIPEPTSEEVKEEMEHGERNEDVYSEEGREKLVEDEEIDPEEAGFMAGAEAGGQLAKDALTGEPLMDIDDVVETEIDGQMYRFVNEENAQKFREKKEQEEL